LKYYIFFLITLFISNCINGTHERPNIVLIIGDDHGWPYYGFMGNQIVQTPVLDELARTGTVFVNGQVTSSICRPSLRTLLTGLYPIQFDNYLDSMKSNYLLINNFANEQEQNLALINYEHQIIRDFYTLPEMLKKNHYKSFEGGKFWEGTYEMAGFDDGMSRRFGKELYQDYHILLALAGGDGLEFARKTQQPVYDFISSNKENPFFIWYVPMLPHTPFNPPEDLLAIYRNLNISESAKVYYAMCTWFDRCMGEFIEYLKNIGEYDNTLFIYVNDNGWEQEPSIDYTGSLEFSTLGGPRGKKSLYDFGFRTPIIFNYGKEIEAGKRINSLVSTIDVFTTILDYAGIPKPSYLIGKSIKNVIDGNTKFVRKNIIGYLKNTRIEGDPWSDGGVGYTYRSDKWHYQWIPSSYESKLFNIQKDYFCDNDLSFNNNELVSKFRKKITNWNINIIKREINTGVSG